jgi:predicted transcriptional regulator
MKRTTIFIDPQSERELQSLARRLRRPVASLVREAIERYVVAERRTATRALGFVAAGRSGRGDVAERHEDLLFETPRRKPKPR